MSILGLLGGTGVWVSDIRGSRVLGGGLAISDTLCACVVFFSTGGVEDDGDGGYLDCHGTAINQTIDNRNSRKQCVTSTTSYTI